VGETDPEAIYDFENHGMEIMSCPIRRLFRLQEKLKLTEKEKKYLIIGKVLLYFSIFQPISVTDLS